jgi:hypothetical protein
LRTVLHDRCVPRPRKQEKTVAVGARLPESLVAALDAEAEAMSPPGLAYSRSDALRVLLSEALAARHHLRAKRRV